MQEQTCPTCYGEGIENHLSRSRAQTFRDSPRFSTVSIVKYAVTLMAYSLKMFFQAHRAHHPQFLSPLLTGRALVPFRGTRLRGLCSNGAIMEGF